MKRKYLLRGIGIGLIVGVLVGYTAFKTGDFTERPQEQSTSSATEAITTEKTSTEKISTEAPTTELVTEITTTEQATENQTTEQITEKPTTEKPTTEQATTEQVTEPVTEIVTEKPTTELITEEPTTEKVTVEPVTEKPVEDKASITVIKGMSSDRIAELVQAAGVIDDYRDFDRWLSVNGYDRSLKVGTFELKKGMSYEEIARILTGK